MANIRLASKLIDGTFPDYDRVIPVNNRHRLQVAPADLRAALARAGALPGQGKTSAITLDLADGTAVLRATGEDGSDLQEDLQVAWDGPAMAIGLSHRYLADFLSQLGTASIWQVEDAASPVVMSSEDDQGLRYTLMPMRV